MFKGRPSKPTTLLKLQGTYEPSRHDNRSDESIATGSPVKPEDLSAAGQSMWETLTTHLPASVLATVDTFALDGLCELWHQYKQSVAQCRRQRTYRNVQMIAMCWKQWFAAAAHFGLTPAARANMKLHKEPEKRSRLDEIKAM